MKAGCEYMSGTHGLGVSACDVLEISVGEEV